MATASVTTLKSPATMVEVLALIRANPTPTAMVVPDGLEDFNQNGVYDPALGELNPIDPMTDGMTEDGQRPQAQACINDELPNILDSINGNFRFAYHEELEAAELGFPSSAPDIVAGWTLTTLACPVSAFIISKKPASSADSALEQEAIDASSISGDSFFPRSLTTWDGNDARLTQYTLSGSGTIGSVRNRLLSDLIGVSQSSIDGLPAGNSSTGSGKASAS